MRNRLLQLLSLRSGEAGITLLMSLYIFGAMSIYYILKPLRSGVFLTKLSSTELIYAYWLSALTAGILATPIYKLSRRYSTITVMTGINVGIIVTLVYFRWALGREIGYLPYLYYVYVQIVPVLSVAQFWLLAGYIYDNRQAKRVYPLLGAGASAGALAGSSVEGFLREHLTPESLLSICIVVCVALIAVSQVSWRQRRVESARTRVTRVLQEKRDRIADLFRLVFGSRHLAIMVVFILLMMITSQIADWQIHDAAYTAFRNSADKVKQQRDIETFFGRFSFATNILCLLVQMFLTAWVLRRGGVGVSILVLPVSVFLSSFGVLAFPLLAATVLVEGCDSIFRYSINRAGMELLYLPLSPDVRKRIKLFIDVFIDRVGRALAGLIIFILIHFQFGLRGTAIAAILLAGFSIVVVTRLRASYVGAFRDQLVRREIDLEPAERFVTDPASVRLLVDALKSSEVRQIIYALRLLQSVRGGDFADRLLPLLSHPSGFVREESVRTLPALRGDHAAEAERLLSDDSEAVRAAAVEYLCARDHSQERTQLVNLLRSDRSDIRIAAARWASGKASGFRPPPGLVRQLLETQGEQRDAARQAAAGLAAILPAPEGIPLLRDLMADPSGEVAAAAIRAAGEAGHLDLLFQILQVLPEQKRRGAARDALISFGSRIEGTLGDVLSDPQRSLALRREIPWVLSRISSERSLSTLVENLGTGDGLLEFRVAKALSRLHEQDPDLAIPGAAISESILAKTRSYYEGLALLQSLESDRDGALSGLLNRALSEHLKRKLEVIFRLLGLLYPQKDIYFAYAALRGEKTDRRNAAIEFLDNLLRAEEKRVILPLLEENVSARLLERARKIFDLPSGERELALERLLGHEDFWLRACTLYEIGNAEKSGLSDLCRKLTSDPEPIVRETAGWALNRSE